MLAILSFFWACQRHVKKRQTRLERDVEIRTPIGIIQIRQSWFPPTMEYSSSNDFIYRFNLWVLIKLWFLVLYFNLRLRNLIRVFLLIWNVSLYPILNIFNLLWNFHQSFHLFFWEPGDISLIDFFKAFFQRYESLLIWIEHSVKLVLFLWKIL